MGALLMQYTFTRSGPLTQGAMPPPPPPPPPTACVSFLKSC